ncbi:MAG TPA: PEGA domain-containing protein [Vicinamibacterales bacterium]
MTGVRGAAAHDGRPWCGATELNHDDPSSFSPPAAFGPFRVLHQIGSGVLGPVFRTYEPERDRLIAVKAFRIDLLPEQSALLATELQRIVDAGLTHPGIVQPVAAGMEGYLPYLAQEYVAAESLDIAMKHYAPANPARVMPFLRQLAGALDAAAAVGILHGALHPRDVFLTTDEARASGFGIVQAIENIGFRAPTRRPYTAPERVGGEDWGAEADVFSLGAIAHELLTGRRPAGPGEQDGSFAADMPAEHRARLREVLARALAEDPSARFESASAFVDALEAAAEGQSAGPAGPSAAAAVAGAAAAPSLFDTDDVEADADNPVIHEPIEPIDPDESPAEPPSVPEKPADEEPIETIDDVEDIDDIEDEDAIEDEDDIEDTGDVEEPEPEPEPDVWPPPGFATDDLDITSEKEADEALADFDLDLNRDEAGVNRVEPVPAAVEPSPVEESAALAAAQSFDYDTAVEEDEAQPQARRDDTGASLPLAAAAGAATGPFGAPPAASRVDTWQPSTPVLHDVPAASGRTALVWAAGALALGLLLGWVIWGRDGAGLASEDQTPQAESGPPVAEPPPLTEVPVPAPVEPAPSTPASAATPPPPSSGRLLVRSTPGNAMVVIDGVWTGRTPLTKRDMSFGAHTVRVVLEGYEPINQRITLTPDNASREMLFELQRSRARGQTPAPQRQSQPAAREPAAPARTPVERDTAPAETSAANATLAVTSRPVGARVLVDGRFVGTTPAKVAGLTPGSHTVRVELEGYQPWSTTVRVAAGQDARVAAPLVPQR